MLVYDGREEASVVAEAVELGRPVLVHRIPGRKLRQAVKKENGKGNGLAFGFQDLQPGEKHIKQKQKGRGGRPGLKCLAVSPAAVRSSRPSGVGCPGPQLRYSTRQKPPWNLVGSPLSQHEKM